MATSMAITPPPIDTPYNDNYVPLFYRHDKNDYTLFEKRIILGLLNKLYNDIVKYQPAGIYSASGAPGSTPTTNKPSLETTGILSVTPLPIPNTLNKSDVNTYFYEKILLHICLYK